MKSSATMLLIGSNNGHGIVMHILLKNLSHENKHYFLLSTSVDLSTWIAYHCDALIFPNNCVSVSDVISSICVIMVLAERGMSRTAGRISSSPIIKFLSFSNVINC